MGINAECSAADVGDCFPPHPALASTAQSLLSVPSTSGKLQHYRQEVWPPFRISFIYKVPHWETFQSGSPCLMELQSHWLMFYCDITGEKTGNGADSRRRFSSFHQYRQRQKKRPREFFFFFATRCWEHNSHHEEHVQRIRCVCCMYTLLISD